MCWSVSIDFSSKTTVILCLCCSLCFFLSRTDFHNTSHFLGYTQTLLRSSNLRFRLYFRIVVLPLGNHAFFHDHRFVVFDQISKSSYFQGYIQIMMHRRAPWLRLYFRMFVFPEENHMFGCVFGFVLWPVSQLA